MIDFRIVKPALVVAGVLALGTGAAFAQDAGGAGNGGAGSGKAEPRVENTQPTLRGMDQDYGAPLQQPGAPQYPDTLDEPASPDTQAYPENPGGPIEEPMPVE